MRRPATRKEPPRSRTLEAALAALAAATPKDETLVVVASSEGVVVRKVRGAPRGRRREWSQRLADRLGEVDVALGMMSGESGVPYENASDLSEDEDRLLDQAGLPNERAGRFEDPAVLGAVEFARLLHDARTVEESAALLGVNGSRIRQRLTRERTLYGIKSGASWRLPRFQFEGRGTVPGIERVFPRIRREVDPVSIYRWFSLPHPDLIAGKEEHPVSPLSWLRSGRDPGAAAAAAATDL